MAVDKNLFKKKLKPTGVFADKDQPERTGLSLGECDESVTHKRPERNGATIKLIKDQNDADNECEAVASVMLSDLEKRIIAFINASDDIGGHGQKIASNKRLTAASTTSPESLRHVLTRMQRKGYLTVVKSKYGPNGWRIFQVVDSLKSLS